MLRPIVLAVLLAGSLCAQMPKGFYAWWASPIVKDLNLTPAQSQQIRATVRQFRPRLIDIRAEVAKAEIDLEAQFAHDPVDQAKANAAIEHLIAARSELTRTLSQMSLKLRTTLSEQQWTDLQRRRPTKGREETSTEPGR
ncbi:MAG TPA: periplasmic heavy metal sensor [Bryobacteraceae bacterium]|nr:periplasmic heavy metal sensor [Bryobacteraceae bacterium]